jgi:hypothetical protein
MVGEDYLRFGLFDDGDLHGEIRGIHDVLDDYYFCNLE